MAEVFPGSLIEFHGGAVKEPPGDTICDDAAREAVQPDPFASLTMDFGDSLVTWLDNEIKPLLRSIDAKLLEFAVPTDSNFAHRLPVWRAPQRTHSLYSGASRGFGKISVTSVDDLQDMTSQDFTIGECGGPVSGHSSPSRGLRFHIAQNSKTHSHAGTVSVKSSSNRKYREDAIASDTIDETSASMTLPRQSTASASAAACASRRSKGSKLSLQSGVSRLFNRSFKGKDSAGREAKMRMIEERIEQHQNPRGPCAAAIWRFFENRYSSPLAKMYAAFSPLFVVSSVFVSFWQTVEGCPLKGLEGQVLQTFFESAFAVELTLRFIVCPDRWQFWSDPLNHIDMVSALPIVYRVTVGILSAGNTHHLNVVLCLIPALRLLKLTRRFENFQLLLSAFLIAFEALPVLLYTLVVIALLFSALIYFAEPDIIYSLPNALWFVIVTMTTVGYGDITPETTLGHAITMVLMMVSALYMAMPIGIVGNAFSQAWGARDRVLLMHRLREAFLHQGFSAKGLQTIVRMFDGDCDGELDFDEFQCLLETMHISMTPDRVLLLLESLDFDGSGKISVDELMNGLFPRDYAELFSNLARTAGADTHTTKASLTSNNTLSPRFQSNLQEGVKTATVHPHWQTLVRAPHSGVLSYPLQSQSCAGTKPHTKTQVRTSCTHSDYSASDDGGPSLSVQL